MSKSKSHNPKNSFVALGHEFFKFCRFYKVRCSLLLSCVVMLVAVGFSQNKQDKILIALAVETQDTFSDDDITINEECHEVTVQAGDLLHTILRGYGVGSEVITQLRSATKNLKKVSSASDAKLTPKIPDALYAGDLLKICLASSGGDLGLSDGNRITTSITYQKNGEQLVYHYVAQGDGFVASKLKQHLVKRVEFVSFAVKKSLYQDALNAGLSDYDIMSFADIFQWDIDFLTGVRQGDKVNVMLEYDYHKGAKTGVSRILVAEYIARKKTYKSYRYERDAKFIGYFDSNGGAKKRRFLRYPLKFTRISSYFNPKRLHPIFKTVRPHRGVDYAAPRHTSVYSVSHGKVIKAGWSRGYGRRVIVDHGNGYSTLYAHLQKIPSYIRHGSSVQQGQTIGYVGSSGWATGPHLHYEFRVRGVHKNPVTVSLPGQPPISKKYIADFKNFIEPIQYEYSLRGQAFAIRNL